MQSHIYDDPIFFLKNPCKMLLQGITTDWLRWLYQVSIDYDSVTDNQEPDARRVYREIGGFTS
ncbi:MAG: hypothetical protein JW891_18545 [Candidatus Lokiarchaeota archaeon]|nr:hypothetical protein [Candidatus Lokiarchaeota archaeon]